MVGVPAVIQVSKGLQKFDTPPPPLNTNTCGYLSMFFLTHRLEGSHIIGQRREVVGGEAGTICASSCHGCAATVHTHTRVHIDIIASRTGTGTWTDTE